MTITLNLPQELEVPLHSAAMMQGKDVAAFLLDTVRQQLRRDTVPEQEATLLLKLQNLFPPDQVQLYQTLCNKSDDKIITDVERERLILLIEQRDLLNAERLEVLEGLARLRGVSLRDVIAQLEIRPV